MASKEQRKLSDFIKGVHQNLRIQSHKLGVEKAWTLHCQETDTLKKYAEYMHRLAVDFWDKNNNEDVKMCRIKWVVFQVNEYFINGGKDKAQKREYFLQIRYFGESSIKIEKNTENNAKLNLLDVGSCYNPFKFFSIFNVVAIDLAPATSDVLRCDFLTVDVIPEKIDNSSSSYCKALQMNSFDIIVFSLLLEYLPSPQQRYSCCSKAYQLLKMDGILCILTPDSKHATANSKVMKSWRHTLATLGFWRITYQKLKHVHCMTYRKCQNPDISKHWLSLQSNSICKPIMNIPQDFHEYCNKKQSKENRTEMENQVLVDNFTFLSNSDVFI
uniref:S-adenosylmethionine sensor upstream of mTORC1 n=2 Tax=Clastoptera arizonana TaxID=38151 RepID=A0A1B6DD62_9HEMI